jgi:hypothetical protein
MKKKIYTKGLEDVERVLKLKKRQEFLAKKEKENGQPRENAT